MTTKAGFLAGLLAVIPAIDAAQPTQELPAVSGRVLRADGSVATSGTVALIASPGRPMTSSIGRDGRFRITTDNDGRQPFLISVPGAAPYHANIVVPRSRAMQLPDIQLSPATYFRARIVSPDGEPLARGIRWSSLDADGEAIPDLLQHVRDEVDTDGTSVIGPLPIGRTILAYDRAPFAQTRLRDITVNGTQPSIDAGTITIAPAARVQVAIVDAKALPVRAHDVWIEDALQPSPLRLTTVRTDDAGNALFDRLGAGRYRVWTRAQSRCRNVLSITRLVSARSGGLATLRIAIDGRAVVRVMTPIGPVLGRRVTLKPEAPEVDTRQQLSNITISPSTMSRLLRIQPTASCSGATDSEGRITFPEFPPGPALLTVELFNSTHVRRITIPENGGDIAIEIPDGLIPVLVIDAVTRRPIASAKVVWSGNGGRIEALTTANGDALIEGAGMSGGTLTIGETSHQTLEGSFTEAPDSLQEVALTPLRSSRVTITIVSDTGAPLRGAIVELHSSRLGDPIEIAETDARGIAQFPSLPPGVLQVIAHADGFITGSGRIEAEDRGPISVALKRAQ